MPCNTRKTFTRSFMYTEHLKDLLNLENYQGFSIQRKRSMCLPCPDDFQRAFYAQITIKRVIYARGYPKDLIYTVNDTQITFKGSSLHRRTTKSLKRTFQWSSTHRRPWKGSLYLGDLMRLFTTQNIFQRTSLHRGSSKDLPYLEYLQIIIYTQKSLNGVFRV